MWTGTLCFLCALRNEEEKAQETMLKDRFVLMGDSCRGTRHRQSESDEVVRGRGRRLVRFVLHKDLAGCVVQQKINADPA